MKQAFLVLIALSIFSGGEAYVGAQIRDPGLNGRSGGHSIYGDIQVDEGQVGGMKPISLTVILYDERRTIIDRQTVSTKGRYRFNNIPLGWYDVAVEVEGQEVYKVRVDLTSPLIGDLKQDIPLAWKSTGGPAPRPGSVSAADRYDRSSENRELFEKAGAAIDKKLYDQAVNLLQKIVSTDPRDFQAWTELANIHIVQKKYPDAETESLRAIDLHPGFFFALLNLGRADFAQQKYEIAIDALSRAVKARPESADANYFLGESYLQMKKGSLAVGYLNEAIRLDPQGMADVHLRLALLYNGAGMKDKAAAEYEAFLKKKPDYQDRKKLEKYISENKKP
jgi:tetratricopeptide (TPR) repeat protein